MFVNIVDVCIFLCMVSQSLQSLTLTKPKMQGNCGPRVSRQTMNMMQGNGYSSIFTLETLDHANSVKTHVTMWSIGEPGINCP
jgi:hypothetical protein